MIPKAQLHQIATENGLLPTTVEKDYILGWVLDGISQHPDLNQWLFKGGTCLKKCYFETFRFSEDLDFTVPQGKLYDSEKIRNALLELSVSVAEETGIEFPENKIEVKESHNKRGKKTFQAKLFYTGPITLPKSAQARIKFDITQDEIVVEKAEMREVLHSYTDSKSPAAKVSCYSINEILAEKSRALYERMGTARDVYDIVNISRHFRENIDPVRARAALRKKYEFKSLPTPSVDLILSKIDQDSLRANWSVLLGHQLRVLPPADAFLTELKDSLSWWIDEKTLQAPILPQISTNTTEKALSRSQFGFTPMFLKSIGVGAPVSGAGQFYHHMEAIRYAARNRLYAVITYNGIPRKVEPYSLRLPKTGNLLVYVFELQKGSGPGKGIAAYKVVEIERVQITQEPFHARYVIEL